jgi:hypothetical protein
MTEASVLGPASGPKRRALGVCAGVLALALVGCTGSGFQYVSSSETNTVFKVPEDWTLYSEDDVFDFRPPDLSPQQEAANRASQWIMAFDGAEPPSLEHLFAQSSKQPAGYAKVRVLSDEERDTYSLRSLRNEEFEVDRLVKEQRIELISDDDVVIDNGFAGSRVVFNVRQGDGFVTVNQTALVDSQTRVLYLFLIGCDAGCYSKNEEVISEVVSSWTVKEQTS